MTSVLIIKLSCDDRTTVFPLQTLNLCEDLSIIAFHVFQKLRIFRARLTTFGKQPVWNAATTCLTMTERSHSQHDGKRLCLANLQERTKMALSTPVILTFYLLNMVPKHIAGQHRDTTLFHFFDFRCPFVGRNPRIVNLAHRWY